MAGFHSCSTKHLQIMPHQHAVAPSCLTQRSRANHALMNPMADLYGVAEQRPLVVSSIYVPGTPIPVGSLYLCQEVLAISSALRAGTPLCFLPELLNSLFWHARNRADEDSSCHGVSDEVLPNPGHPDQACNLATTRMVPLFCIHHTSNPQILRSLQTSPSSFSFAP